MSGFVLYASYFACTIPSAVGSSSTIALPNSASIAVVETRFAELGIMVEGRTTISPSTISTWGVISSSFEGSSLVLLVELSTAALAGGCSSKVTDFLLCASSLSSSVLIASFFRLGYLEQKFFNDLGFESSSSSSGLSLLFFSFSSSSFFSSFFKLRACCTPTASLP